MMLRDLWDTGGIKYISLERASRLFLEGELVSRVCFAGWYAKNGIKNVNVFGMPQYANEAQEFLDTWNEKFPNITFDHRKFYYVRPARFLSPPEITETPQPHAVFLYKFSGKRELNIKRVKFMFAVMMRVLSPMESKFRDKEIKSPDLIQEIWNLGVSRYHGVCDHFVETPAEEMIQKVNNADEEIIQGLKDLDDTVAFSYGAKMQTATWEFLRSRDVPV